MDQHSQCLVVDSSYMARSVISTERAFVINYKGNAEVLSNHPTYFSTVNRSVVYAKPSVIRVFRYVKVGYNKVPLTRANIYKRDGFSCVYCGSVDRKRFTLDHVVPRSKGGKDTWDNLVTACKSCNTEKADLTIKEWGKQHPNPKRPHYLMLLKTIEYIPQAWKQYLFY